eukprot:IDg14725t1
MGSAHFSFVNVVGNREGIQSPPAIPDNKVAWHLAQGFQGIWALESPYPYYVSVATRARVVANYFVRDFDGSPATIAKVADITIDFWCFAAAPPRGRELRSFSRTSAAPCCCCRTLAHVLAAQVGCRRTTLKGCPPIGVSFFPTSALRRRRRP